jgi:hypothetical protein
MGIKSATLFQPRGRSSFLALRRGNLHGPSFRVTIDRVIGNKKLKPLSRDSAAVREAIEWAQQDSNLHSTTYEVAALTVMLWALTPEYIINDNGCQGAAVSPLHSLIHHGYQRIAPP